LCLRNYLYCLTHTHSLPRWLFLSVSLSLSLCPPFLFTLLFNIINNNKNNSGRDIICFPNALLISDRDFVQSFESRHGRHGNSNLVTLFVYIYIWENNHCSKSNKLWYNKLISLVNSNSEQQQTIDGFFLIMALRHILQGIL